MFVDRGEGIFESETTDQISLVAPSVIFLFPGVWHRYRPRKEVGWTERWLCFNGELAHRLMEMALLPQASPIRRIADVRREGASPLSFRRRSAGHRNP